MGCTLQRDKQLRLVSSSQWLRQGVMEVGQGLGAKSGRVEPSRAEPSQALPSQSQVNTPDSLGVAYFLGRMKLSSEKLGVLRQSSCWEGSVRLQLLTPRYHDTLR